MMAANRVRKLARLAILATVAALAVGSAALAQDKQEKQKRVYLEANAQGTSTQMGRIGTIQFIIEGFSTDEDRATLIQAFQSGGTKELYDALEKQSSKGRVRIPGGLGYDINYVKVFQQPDGSRKMRIVTNRPILMGEVRNATRSSDYSLSIADIDFPAGSNKGTGTLIPAAEITVDKGELTVEAYQNPWKLTSVRQR